MRNVLLVGLGGCLGAISRYVLGEFVKQRVPNHPHFGTFAVNVLGCLLIGLVMSFALVEDSGLSDSWKLLIVTGGLGALTTFSTFGFETITLLEEQRYQSAVVNVLGSLVVGLPAVWIGLRIGRAIAA